MIDSFLKYLQFEKRYSAKTVLSYQTDLLQFEAFLRQTFETNETQAAHFGMIRGWITELSDAGLEATSINRKIATLRSYFKFLLKQEAITQNPMTKVRVLKTHKKLPQFVNETDMVKILDQVSFADDLEGYRDRLILELFYGTGIRLTELIQLKDTSVRLPDRTIRVLGKRNKERIVPFPASLVPLIEKYRTQRNKEIPKNEHGLLLVTNTGEALYPMLVQRLIRKYLGVAATEKKSPHVLRHTFATHLLNKGAEINAVKDLLGHTSLAATQVYTHNTIDKLKKIFDKAHPKA
ncbi:MAG: tyrosine-type recombinase/integrase [Bacteroidota bacterium]